VAASIFSKARDFLRTPGSEPVGAKPPVAKKISTAYHSVSIAPGVRCCGAARELKGQRFLSREAPPLPLKACTQPECTCHYEHHTDRRVRPRRATDMGVAVDGWLESDRRGEVKRGRRKNDR
jgi:hypothetical protein